MIVRDFLINLFVTLSTAISVYLPLFLLEINDVIVSMCDFNVQPQHTHTHTQSIYLIFLPA